MCDEFATGATEAGHNAEKIRVYEKNIHPLSLQIHFDSQHKKRHRDYFERGGFV